MSETTHSHGSPGSADYERMMEADPAAMSERPLSARALKRVIDADKAAGKPPMTFAMVFPVSTHNYEIRYWMASAGIDPDNDVRLIVIPPPQMVANLEFLYRRQMRPAA